MAERREEMHEEETWFKMSMEFLFKAAEIFAKQIKKNHIHILYMGTQSDNLF